MPKYTIVLAVYNEEDLIESVLDDLNSVFFEIGDYEIYVSEDGSQDRTRAVVDRIRSKNKRVRISEPGPRLGYSKAILRAMIESRGEILIFIDGDGQTKGKDIVELLLHSFQGPGTIALGCRVDRKDGKLRDIYSYLFKSAYILAGFTNLKDPSTGSVIAWKSDLLPFIQHDPIMKFGFWWEFQAWVDTQSLTRIETPIPHYPRQVGKTRVYISTKIVKIAISHLIALFKLRQIFLD